MSIEAGYFVRVKDGIYEGCTGVVERAGVADVDVRLTSTGRLVVLPRIAVQSIVGRPVTVETTQQRARQGRAA